MIYLVKRSAFFSAARVLARVLTEAPSSCWENNFLGDCHDILRARECRKEKENKKILFKDSSDVFLRSLRRFETKQNKITKTSIGSFYKHLEDCSLLSRWNQVVCETLWLTRVCSVLYVGTTSKQNKRNIKKSCRIQLKVTKPRRKRMRLEHEGN